MKSVPLEIKTIDGPIIVRAYTIDVNKGLYAHRTLGANPKYNYWTISNVWGYAICRINKPIKLKDLMGKTKMLTVLDWGIKEISKENTAKYTELRNEFLATL